MPSFFKRTPPIFFLGLLCLLADALLFAHLRQSYRDTLAEAAQTLYQASEAALRRSETLFDKVDRTLSGIAEAVQFHGHAISADDIELHRLLIRRHAITPALH